MTEHIPVPSEHAPVKDMTTDAFRNRVTIWEPENGENGAWITADESDLIEAKDQLNMGETSNEKLQKLVAEWDEKSLVGEPGASIYAECAQALSEAMNDE